jgi:hypothetical protein
MEILTNRFSDTSWSTDVYIQAKYIRNKKINENKLVGGTTTWGTIWGPVYEHLRFSIDYIKMQTIELPPS